MVDCKHGGDVGQQRLRSADVGGGLVAADVLLARLHRHAQRRLALRVLAHTCASRDAVKLEMHADMKA